MVESLQEWPDVLRQCDQARRRVRRMFVEYRQRFIDNWEPAPCPPREEFR